MPRIHVEILPWLSQVVLPGQSGRILVDEEIDGERMQDLLEALAARYPLFAEKVYLPERKDTTDIVEITVNGEMLNFSNTLDATLKDGDSVALLPAFVGG